MTYLGPSLVTISSPILWTVPWNSANHVPTLALSKEASYQISRWYIDINGNFMISNTNFIEGFILNLKMIYIYILYIYSIQMAYMIANTNFTMSSNSFYLFEKKTSRLLFSKMSFESITLQLSCLRLIPASSSNSRYASVRFNDGSISTASYGAFLSTTGRVGWMWCWWQTFQGANYTSICVAQKMGITVSYIYTCILNMYLCMTEFLDLYKVHEFPWVF